MPLPSAEPWATVWFRLHPVCPLHPPNLWIFLARSLNVDSPDQTPLSLLFVFQNLSWHRYIHDCLSFILSPRYTLLFLNCLHVSFTPRVSIPEEQLANGSHQTTGHPTRTQPVVAADLPITSSRRGETRGSNPSVSRSHTFDTSGRRVLSPLTICPAHLPDRH